MKHAEHAKGHSGEALQPILREAPRDQWVCPWGAKGQPNDHTFYTASTTREEQLQQAVKGNLHLILILEAGPGGQGG